MAGNKIKSIVSKNKIRLRDGNFDLDLTYICPNIIAMGFPAESLERMYRNDMEHVVKFLNSHHQDHYKVYNLCSERNYDTSRFDHRVAHYPFDDHNPPRIELIRPFCEDVMQWLAEDKDNVAAIHCKAGKGRTGVMICALLLHQGRCLTAAESMEYYGKIRTTDGKGVTIPSQRRYVQYYGELVKRNTLYKTQTVLLKRVQLYTIPMMSSGTCCPFFTVHQHKVKIHTQEAVKGVKKGLSCVEFELPHALPIRDDVKIEFYHKSGLLKMDKRLMFHMWFNTYFIVHPIQPDKDYFGQARSHSRPTSTVSCPSPDQARAPFAEDEMLNGGEEFVLELHKDEIDKANKDKTNKVFSPNLKVKLFFARGREDQVPPTPEPSEGNLSPSQSENDLLDDQDLDDGTDSGDEDCIYETSESSVV
ncbi:phosphatidylinositol 3,4,5-trisphosphate 3-phosphatase and dual-specificity protein phosphatase PTEN-like [Strongylocentrotus purpuratus]|uniref:Phosphatidylinositol 3,4,5-trisphosphate 3-phosphatase and dual-specificity protein phosphatase PTEN n=2 Tax=Strongylocentrotus purpuratus TaxID=7668 RepID=A0A7M7NE78_STRPU|nr:phosphatidylinositol 3,4,5-trisphosphate 3-phosphatase and dual-specificity protein phosphatase PTEN-like [Strongylocentrotus purpuratus]|eukprot:XP_003723944.1 PREDICTED: phosphatidylinositol 3,4,5-trisphosphate 3-phosphatase and dual-specificity protein phosphatase PTEN [Strongylocentrotus purpuratus]